MSQHKFEMTPEMVYGEPEEKTLAKISEAGKEVVDFRFPDVARGDFYWSRGGDVRTAYGSANRYERPLFIVRDKPTRRRVTFTDSGVDEYPMAGRWYRALSGTYYESIGMGNAPVKLRRYDMTEEWV